MICITDAIRCSRLEFLVHRRKRIGDGEYGFLEFRFSLLERNVGDLPDRIDCQLLRVECLRTSRISRPGDGTWCDRTNPNALEDGPSVHETVFQKLT